MTREVILAEHPTFLEMALATVAGLVTSFTLLFLAALVVLS